MEAKDAGPTEAARHFDVPVSRVKQWVFVKRHGKARKDRKSKAKPAPLVILDGERNARAHAAPGRWGIGEPSERPMVARVDASILRRLEYLERPDSVEGRSQQSAAMAVAILLDKRAAIEDLDRRLRAPSSAAVPGTPEWEAEQLAALAAFPPHLLEAARRKQQAGE
jgi:hypothetical protein